MCVLVSSVCCHFFLFSVIQRNWQRTINALNVFHSNQSLFYFRQENHSFNGTFIFPTYIIYHSTIIIYWESEVYMF